MKRSERPLTYFLFSILLLGVFASPAHAYLDPGTGSIILQTVVAALAGSLMAIKVFWRNITGFFAVLANRNKEKE